MKKKLSKQQLDARVSQGAKVFGRDKKPTQKAEAPPAVKEPDQAASPQIDMTPVGEGMAAMAATIKYLQQSQDRVAKRVEDELSKLNARNKARITVIKRDEYGGIDTAEIEVI